MSEIEERGVPIEGADEEPEEDTRRDFEMLTHKDLCDEFAELLDLYAEDGDNFIQSENIEDSEVYL